MITITRRLGRIAEGARREPDTTAQRSLDAVTHKAKG